MQVKLKLILYLVFSIYFLFFLFKIIYLNFYIVYE